jgi:hypothetical protein
MTYQHLDNNGKPLGNVVTPTVTTKSALAGSSVEVFSNIKNYPVLVRVLAEGGYVHYLIGPNTGTVTATSSQVPLPGDVAEQIRIPALSKIAFIGSVPVYVTECEEEELV